MANLTERFGLSYFGGPVPGSLTQNGAKFTLIDPQVIDRVLAALEDHTHAGGVRVEDPGTDEEDAPDAVLETTGGDLPGGRTFYYSISYVDRYGLESARSAEVEVVTDAPISIPLPPSLTARDPQTAVREGQLTARVVAVDAVTASGGAKIDGIDLAVGDRVLLTDQGDAAKNGLYVVAPGAWTRTTDTITAATEVWITEGSKYKKRLWTQTAEVTTLDTSKQTWIIVPGLRAELHSYALTAIAGDQETPLSIPAQVSPPALGAAVITLPELPDGAEEFRVWRKAFTDNGWTRLGTTEEGVFTDDGRVPTDKCACDPENMPPAVNTTNGENRVHITLGDPVVGSQQQQQLQAEEMGIVAWRLYRTEVSDAYGARCLVEEIQVRDRTTGVFIPTRPADETTVAGQPDATLAFYEAWDDGAPLLVGSPIERSTTLTPTQPIPIPTGVLPEVVSDLPLHMLWLEEASDQLFYLDNVNDDRVWTPVRAFVADGSVRDQHVAADAAIAMSKLALDPLLTRVDTLEARASTSTDALGDLGTTVAAAGARVDALEVAVLARLTALETSARDDTALHYRGAYVAGEVYQPQDLVVQDGQLYLTTVGQDGGVAFDPAVWSVFPPATI